MPQNIQERLASAVVKRKAEESGNNNVTLKTGGKPVQVTLGPPPKQCRQITHGDMMYIQAHADLIPSTNIKMTIVSEGL